MRIEEIVISSLLVVLAAITFWSVTIGGALQVG